MCIEKGQVMKLLFLYNELNDTWPVSLKDLFVDSGFEVDQFNTSKNHFPKTLDGYHCIFLSGSILSAYDQEDWILKEEQLIRQAAEMEIGRAHV